MYGVTRQSALRAYFLAAASTFEPSRAAERLAWARTAVLAEAISGCLLMSSNTHDDRTMTAEWLVDEFVNSDDDNPARSVATLLCLINWLLAQFIAFPKSVHRVTGLPLVAQLVRVQWKREEEFTSY